MSYKVLHLIGGGEIGGAEQHILTLFNNFNQDSVQPYLACLVVDSPLAALARSQGFCTRVFPMHFPLDITPVFPLVKFCRTNRIDIIHTHGARANLVGRLTGKFLSLPCITTVHSLPEYDYASAWKGKTALILDRFTISFSSGIITVSNYIQESLFKRLRKKVGSVPVRTIYNGSPQLDLSNRNQLRHTFRKKWGISEEKTVIGTIGRLHPVKGHTYLISAFQLLAQEIPDLHLLLIGDGPMGGQLRDALQKADLSYTMPGYLSSAWCCLPVMDIFVLPSLNEGMGIVLLEAAQAEVPMVVSGVGGIPEIWENQINAIIVNPSKPEEIAEACRRILKDGDLSKHLIANALQRAKSLTEKNMTDQTTAFYDHIATASRK